VAAPLNPRADLGLVLVTGANGNLGRRLLVRLSSAGPPRAKLRALVRSERAAQALRALPESAAHEVHVVDYQDADALARAAQGCTCAVHLVGILKESSRTRYIEAHETTSWAIAHASAKAGIRRIVYLSMLGADPASPNACLASKGRAEAILLGRETPATVLRVPMVLGRGDLAARALRAQALARVTPLVRGGASLEQPIDAGDVVEAIVEALCRPELAGAVLELAGPEALSHRALVERAAQLFGRRPHVLAIPLSLARLAARLAQRVLSDPPLTPSMLDVLEHDDCIDPAPACAQLGIRLTPLDETLRRQLGPAAAP
jgi:NADH dehydrogenase